MEFALTSQDKMDKIEPISQRILLLIGTYSTYQIEFFREERLLSHIINSLLTLLVRSVQ